MGEGGSVKGLLRAGLIMMLASSLGACITTKKDIQFLHDQIVALNSRVERLREKQEKTDKRLSGDLERRIEARLDARLSSGVEADIRSVREIQASLVAEVDRVKETIQDLSGRMDENNHLVRRVVERDTTEQDALRARLAELTGKVARLEAAVARIDRYLALEPEQAKREAAKAESTNKTQPVEKKEVPAVEQASEAELYDKNLAAYRQGKYEEAISGFNAFLKKYGKSDLADNAQFWIGECYMALKQYEQAILAYQEVIKRYPKGNKVPNAMLRQALAFQAIDDKVSAKLILKRIVKRHPNSSEAKIAKAKLKTLK